MTDELDDFDEELERLCTEIRKGIDGLAKLKGQDRGNVSTSLIKKMNQFLRSGNGIAFCHSSHNIRSRAILYSYQTKLALQRVAINQYRNSINFISLSDFLISYLLC